MKKFKKILLLSCVLVILLSSVIFGFYKLFKNKNSLSISEKTWINNNKNSVYSISIPNDINTFGKNGLGVFFDYIKDLEKDLNLKLNSNVYSINEKNDSFGFMVGNSFDTRDLLLYTDYYVTIGGTGSLKDLNSISENIVGVLKNDLNYISTFYSMSDTIKSYDNADELFEAIDNKELEYAIVPLNKYKDTIINKSYNICYFLNDAKVYYYLHLGSDKTLNSILTKYYNIWMENNFDQSYNSNNYQLFLNSLNISDIDEDKLTDKNYKFEYLVKQPYSLLSRGNYSGIVNQYLNSFHDFSGIDFTFNKVSNYKDLKYDIDKKKVDLYFNQYNFDNQYLNINVNFPIYYYLIGNRKATINIDSLKSYKGVVYVEENSLLYNYLENYKDITIKTYTKHSKINKIIKNNNLVIIDKLTYDNYINDEINNEIVVLSDVIDNKTYTFNYVKKDTFYKLFSNYVNTLNPKEMINSGLDKYFDTYEAGSKTVKLAKYIILLIIVILIGVYLLIKSKKRVVLNTKVKNNEKIRYVDMLTSLKNRNYLNDRMEIWNQNTVYPQCVIVLDLNNIKYLNDTFGHEEGDKQIKSAANALFKTQLENTELLRTDGNEFMVYLVGYTEKQIISYIKKLLKEFKKLPYDYGVAVGFSMINDDLKLIEDAFNEATLLMRKNKSSFEEQNEK